MTIATVAELGERALIERIRARVPAAPPWVVVGIGDDAAIVEPDRNRFDAVTADTLVEGVHFDRAFVPASAIGFKALAVNLSDLAAMGAAPRVALLSLGLPEAFPVADLDALVDGLLSAAQPHGVALVGGNITRSPGPLFVDVTAVGSVHRRRAVTRRGARPGDGLYVTGTVGAAAAGLQALRAGVAASGPGLSEPIARFLRPDPRVRFGMLLGRSRAATACVDLSDGLGDGLRQLADAGGVGFQVDAAAVPVDAAASAWFHARGLDPVEAAVEGGEDYELLFTVPARRGRALAAVVRMGRGLRCTRIGHVTAETELSLVSDGRIRSVPEGFLHFR